MERIPSVFNSTYVHVWPPHKIWTWSDTKNIQLAAYLSNIPYRVALKWHQDRFKWWESVTFKRRYHHAKFGPFFLYVHQNQHLHSPATRCRSRELITTPFDTDPQSPRLSQGGVETASSSAPTALCCSCCSPSHGTERSAPGPNTLLWICNQTCIVQWFCNQLTGSAIRPALFNDSATS